MHNMKKLVFGFAVATMSVGDDDKAKVAYGSGTLMVIPPGSHNKVGFEV